MPNFNHDGDFDDRDDLWDDDWDDQEQPQEEPSCHNCCDRGSVGTGWLLRLVRKYTRHCPDCRPTRLDVAAARARQVLRWLRRPRRRPGGDDESPF